METYIKTMQIYYNEKFNPDNILTFLENVYKNNFKVIDRSEKKGWVCIKTNR